MEQLALEYMLADEGTMYITNFALVVLGGFIARYLKTIEIPLRRVSYLFLIAGLYIGFAVSQLGWFLAPAAAEIGLLSVLFIVMLGIVVVFGMGYYWLSAGRSVDIDGSTGAAWLGFVPLANLWLMFKKGETSEPRHWAASFVLDPFLVILALLMIGFTNVVMDQMANYQPSDSRGNEAIVELAQKTLSVEEIFEAEARFSQASLPMKVDNITTMTGMVAEGKALRFIYDVEGGVTSFSPGFKAVVAKTPCEPESFLSVLKRGGKMIFEYNNVETGKEIDTITITIEDCRGV